MNPKTKIAAVIILYVVLMTLDVSGIWKVAFHAGFGAYAHFLYSIDSFEANDCWFGYIFKLVIGPIGPVLFFSWQEEGSPTEEVLQLVDTT